MKKIVLKAVYYFISLNLLLSGFGVNALHAQIQKRKVLVASTKSEEQELLKIDQKTFMQKTLSILNLNELDSNTRGTYIRVIHSDTLQRIFNIHIVKGALLQLDLYSFQFKKDEFSDSVFLEYTKDDKLIAGNSDFPDKIKYMLTRTDILSISTSKEDFDAGAFSEADVLEIEIVRNQQRKYVEVIAPGFVVLDSLERNRVQIFMDFMAQIFEIPPIPKN